MVKYRTLPKAFTLIELLLALTVFSALLLIVVPYGQELLEKNSSLAYASELQSMLRFTRDNAILLGEPVTFCGSKNHKDCNGS